MKFKEYLEHYHNLRLLMNGQPPYKKSSLNFAIELLIEDIKREFEIKEKQNIRKVSNGHS